MCFIYVLFWYFCWFMLFAREWSFPYCLIHCLAHKCVFYRFIRSGAIQKTLLRRGVSFCGAIQITWFVGQIAPIFCQFSKRGGGSNQICQIQIIKKTEIAEMRPKKHIGVSLKTVSTYMMAVYPDSSNSQRWWRPDSANPQKGSTQISSAKFKKPTPLPSKVSEGSPIEIFWFVFCYMSLNATDS